MTKRKRSQPKKGGAGGLDAAAVLRVFRDGGKPLAEREVLRALSATKAKKQELHDILRALEDSGKLIRVKKGYGLVESMRSQTWGNNCLNRAKSVAPPADWAVKNAAQAAS